mgnify:FL=1
MLELVVVTLSGELLVAESEDAKVHPAPWSARLSHRSGVLGRLRHPSTMDE